MRRPINWLVVLISAIFLITGMTLPGCGSSGSGDTGPGPGNPPAVSGMLRLVRDAAELETVLKGALTEAVANTGDAVYYARNERVWGSFRGTPSQLNGPVLTASLAR